MKPATPRILAVDDNKQNLAVLTKALTAANYEIITASDGRSLC
jgi:CheY-like chemotaxis protein